MVKTTNNITTDMTVIDKEGQVTYTYIKYDINGKYVTFASKFNEELYNNIGSTYEDYLNNKWVLLSEEQVSFHKEHPNASVKEVWDLALTPAPERTLEQAQFEKIMEIEHYDSSEAVNSFTINNVLPAWFTPSERTNYALSINAAKLLNMPTLTFAVGGQVLQVPAESAEGMLSQIQLYADACYMQTMKHKMAVQTLTTIEEVDNYDFTTGYPEKLNFNLI